MRAKTQASRNFIDYRKDPGQFAIEHFSNGQRVCFTSKTTLVDMATATGTGTITVTLTDFIPAGVIFLGITARVINILAGSGLTTWSLGITSHVDHFATTKALAVGTTVNVSDYKVGDMPSPYYTTSAQSILFTGAAGVFSTGKVRVTIYYTQLTVATS